MLHAGKTRLFDGSAGPLTRGWAPGLHRSVVQGIMRPQMPVLRGHQEQVQTARCYAQSGRRLQTPQYCVLPQGRDRSPRGAGGPKGRDTDPRPSEGRRGQLGPWAGRSEKRRRMTYYLNKVAFGE